MENRHHRRSHPPPTPPPNVKCNPFLDLSNYKTPLLHSERPNPNPSPIFFTARKTTPFSSAKNQKRINTKANFRLKALELEQSQSARKVDSLKAKSLRSFSLSATVWLNWLFEESGNSCEDVRDWKRRRKSLEEESGVRITGKKLVILRESLKEICSVDDLRERMKDYISRKGCEEVLFVMSKLCKNIDERRLKMKANCPIITDVALKEKSVKALMCYNSTWLRTGLYLLFGGNSLLHEQGNSDQESLFLKLIIEKQFFTHMRKAKSYVYNKLVEDLEALGSIILKKFLLLVIILDKAKCESTLSLNYGIDGKDGGSPLLYDCCSHIKSSKQTVQEFLSDAMHGEGDLLSHIETLGCKLNYQQSPLVEYDFTIKNMFEDFQDGVRLCRAIQLLKSDASILSKVIAQPDSIKKKLQNCSIALQYLKQAGVPLSDEDGVQIEPEDIVNGDKELSLSLLWNMFVHLQVPQLIDKTLFTEEIAKVKSYEVELDSFEGCTELDLLLSWIKAVCKMQHTEVDDFSSLFTGKAFSCLVKYYFGNKDNEDHKFGDFAINSEEAYKLSFIRSVATMQGKLRKNFQLYNMLDQDFPNDERSAVIFLVFFSSQLINGRNLVKLEDRKSSKRDSCTGLKAPIVYRSPFLENAFLQFNKFQPKRVLEFESPEENSGLKKDSQSGFPLKIGKIVDQPDKTAYVVQSNFDKINGRRKGSKIKVESSLQETAASVIQTHFREFILRKRMKVEVEATKRENAATAIQTPYKRFSEERSDLQLLRAVYFLQTAVRAWLAVKSKYKLEALLPSSAGSCDGYLRFMVERHTFIKIRNSVYLIQKAIRSWISLKQRTQEEASIIIQSVLRGHIARLKYFELKAAQEKQQSISLEFENDKHLSSVVTKIQSNWRRYKATRSLLPEQIQRKDNAVIIIQSFIRRNIARQRYFELRAAREKQQSISLDLENGECLCRAAAKIQSNWKRYTTTKFLISHKQQIKDDAVIFIQSFVRGSLTRHRYHELKASLERQQSVSLELENGQRLCRAATKIQSNWKRYKATGSWISQKQKMKNDAAIIIQSFIRGIITRLRYLEFRSDMAKQRNISLEPEHGDHLCRAATKIQYNWKRYKERHLQAQKIYAAIQIQSCWRSWYTRKIFLAKLAAVKKIQSGFQCAIHQKSFRQYRCAAIEMQRFIRGFNTRKRLIGASCINYTSYSMTITYQSPELKTVMDSILKIQRWWKHVLLVQSRTKSVIMIQAFIRGWNDRMIAKKKKHSALTIQRWWRKVLLTKLKKSVTCIQAHFRGWIVRKAVQQDKRRIVLIQSHWKGYTVRKQSKEQVADLRFRLKKSCVNIDDNDRLINRLVAALSELLGYKSVTNIRCLCATLDTATQYSQKCCETLVSAGAINILLKQFHSLNRGVPDQEVLKHVVSILRNISYHPPLLLELINTPDAVTIIFQEFLRNKSEVFFITYELLEKICQTHDGLFEISRLHLLNRRLFNLVHDLERRVELQKRNPRLCSAKDNTCERLSAASNILLLISNAVSSQ